MNSKKKGEKRWIKPSQQTGATLKKIQSQVAKPHSMVYKPKSSPMLEYNKKKMQESHKKYTQFIEHGKKNANKNSKSVGNKNPMLK